MISLFFEMLSNINVKKIKDGKEFEIKVGKIMEEVGMIKRKKDEVNYLMKIKKNIMCEYEECIKLKPTLIDDENIYFVHQPYGTQSFPDYLIIKNNKIIPIEIKFTVNSSNPMWNGSLPKQHTIYIYASKRMNSLTYFLGKDIISKDEIKKLNLIWDRLQVHLDELRKEINIDNPYGFDVYLRKTFYQRKQKKKYININYFKNNKKRELENNVLDFINNI